MEPPAFPAWRRGITALLVLQLLITVPFLGLRTVWSTDEGRYSEIAREMVETGDWKVPRIGGVPYGSYPPLAFWLMAGSGSVLGFTEGPMRLPGAMAAAALVAVVAFLGRRIAGSRAGLLAGLALVTFSGFHTQAITARGDVLITLFAVMAFERFLAVAEGDSRPATLVALYASIAAGILTKGPLALVIPGLGVAAWLVLNRRWNVLAALKPWIGTPAVLLAVLPWYYLVWREAGWDFIRLNLLHENVRAFTDGYEQARPAHFYLGVLPLRTMPWLLLLPLAALVHRERGVRLPLAWLGALFLFLTISSAKRPNYLTYLYPALALTAGVTMDALASTHARAFRIWLAAVVGAGTLALGLASVLPVRWPEEIHPALGMLRGGLIAAAAGGAVMLAFILRVSPPTGAIGVGVLISLALAVSAAVLQPRVDVDGRQARDFCRRVASRIPESAPIWTLAPEQMNAACHFYVGRTMPPRDGAAGHYIVASFQADRLVAAGHRIEYLDGFDDRRGRRHSLIRVLP